MTDITDRKNRQTKMTDKTNERAMTGQFGGSSYVILFFMIY